MAIGVLAGGLAHDMNNILSVIMAYASVALSTLDPDEPLHGDVAQIQRAAERAAQLTKQLSEFGRRQVVDARTVCLHGVILRAESMLRILVGERIGLVVDLAKASALVRADPLQVERVLTNLVVNARDATPSGGEIRIGTAEVAVHEANAARHPGVSRGHYVVLSVEDTGHGMDEPTRLRVFEPFFTTKGAGGTGLGLAVVERVVAEAGGHVCVRSIPGKGTTFDVYLPRATQEEAPTVPPKGPVPSTAGTETVLVVEDDEAFRTAVCRMMRSQGYRVLEAANAGEALLICQGSAGPIDVMLADVVLPRVGARELTAQVRQLRPDIAIVLMSGYEREALKRDGAVTGDEAYVAKPLAADALLGALRSAIEGRGRGVSGG